MLVKVVAKFENQTLASAARDSLNATLQEASREAADLYRFGGGVADAGELSRIYARYGLRNQIGWTLERPVYAEGRELHWELPDGLFEEDAENLLWVFGAEDVSSQTIDPANEPWREISHPAVALIDDDEYSMDSDFDDDSQMLDDSAKKTIH